MMRKIDQIFFVLILMMNSCSQMPGSKAASGWQPINPGGGGWFMCIGAGPTGILIVCSDVSGAYRSLDHGKSWDVIGSNRGLKFTHVNTVGFDPRDEKIIYLGLDGALYRSQDKGETFTSVLEGGYWGAISISPADPHIGYACPIGLTAHVYKTTDRGQTWVAVDKAFPEKVRAIRLVSHPTDPNTVYMVSGEHRFGSGVNAVFRSTDGGQNWSRIGEDLGQADDIGLDPSNPQTIYMTVKGKGVFRSKDNGQTWTQQSNVWGRIFVKSSLILRVVTEQSVWETKDGGQRWAVKSTVKDWTKPGWQPAWHFNSGEGVSIGNDMSDPDAYYYVNQQFVYGSFDGGKNFSGLYTREVPAASNHWSSTGINNTEVYDLEISEADPHLIYIGMWDMGIWRSRDSGETWQPLNQNEFGWEGGRGGDVRTILTDPARPQVVWAGSRRTAAGGLPSEYLIRSDHFGDPGSWVNVGNGLPDPNLASEIWGLSLDRTSPSEKRTLFVTAAGSVYRSADDGHQWTKVFFNGTARITAVDRSDGRIVYAGGSSFWRSSNGGETWEKSGLPEMRGVYDIKVDPTHSRWVYVVCYGNQLGLYRSKDGGETWEHLWVNNVARGVAIHPVNPNTIYATSSLNDCCGAGPTGSAGVVRSTDGGVTWVQVNEGLPWPFAWPVEIDPANPAWVMIGAPGTGYYKRLFPAE